MVIFKYGEIVRFLTSLSGSLPVVMTDSSRFLNGYHRNRVDEKHHIQDLTLDKHQVIGSLWFFSAKHHARSRHFSLEKHVRGFSSKD